MAGGILVVLIVEEVTVISQVNTWAMKTEKSIWHISENQSTRKSKCFVWRRIDSHNMPWDVVQRSAKSPSQMNEHRSFLSSNRDERRGNFSCRGERMVRTPILTMRSWGALFKDRSQFCSFVHHWRLVSNQCHVPRFRGWRQQRALWWVGIDIRVEHRHCRWGTR